MKIKRLELSGFKSFVDRTVVTFDHAVMGIVGPNGCGKSNIVDAIRWCMGEQSAKHLRGRSMEDVIFNGSESRPGSDYAEVTLTFENDDPSEVPFEYQAFPEIAVTRRLHRSGESEYLVNKTHVRLKDVTDLFLGTGVGTKAYSIVEQGKIGLIVSAKPEDRRILIEEAAGITKFKSRKKQAERKMELTAQNLLRVGDIVSEIERSLGTLKRQAAKAERYLAYRKELEDLQLWDASHRFLELSAWVKVERSAVEVVTTEHDGARDRLDALEGELEAERQAVYALEAVLEEASRETFARENDVRSAHAAIERADERRADARRRAEQADEELASVAAQSDELGAERDLVTKEVAACEGDDGAAAELLALEEGKLEDVGRALGEAEATVVGLRDALGRARTEIATAEAKLGGFARRREELGARRDRLATEQTERGELARAATERAGARATRLGELRGAREASLEEAKTLEVRLGELRAAIAEAEHRLEDVKGDASRTRSRLQALEEMHARHDGVGAGAKALLATHDAALVGLAGDLVEAPEELTQALAGLVGARLEDVVVADPERGLELLEGLREGKRGRATLLPLRPRRVAGRPATLPVDPAVRGRFVDRLRFAPENEELVRSLVGDAVLVDDVAALRRLRGKAEVTLVALDGTVLAPDGRLAGGAADDVAAHRLDTKRETRELDERLGGLDAAVRERLEAFHALREALGAAEGALDAARRRAHADELELVTAETEARAAETEAAGHEARLAALASELDELARALAGAEAEEADARALLERASLAGDEAAARIGDAEADALARRAAVDDQRRLVVERKVASAGIREKLAGHKSTLQRLARTAEELDARASRLVRELEALAVEEGTQAGEAFRHREALAYAEAAAELARATSATARAEFEAARASHGERDGELKDLRGALDELRTRLAGHELQLRERELSLGHLEGGVREKFRGLDLRRVVGDYHLRPPPDDDVRARLHELAGLIERMGSVNLDAMREHEDAEKRFAFYSEQKADLDQAMLDLEKAIQQMNRESKKLFQETFEQVNARFQEIFPRMFRGGRASLRLTNPEDMLETGIDILAQPPGKKLASIELMSGGEKALTAVSLIFAIFQIKPSPFCVLDEVDAPLDEGNVGRYCEMIRSMTDRSQFILITHIKKTMQMVDVLHGVTMQEPGVSRLVSVKVSEAAREGRSTITAGPRTKAEPGVAVA